MDKFYHKVAESVMKTYKDEVTFYGGKDKFTGQILTHNGFSIMGKGISYMRIDTDHILMSLIIPKIMSRYHITDRDAKKIYYLLEDGLKKRVRTRMMLNTLKRMEDYYNGHKVY